MSHPMYAGERARFVLRLQREYGNRYVQRLVKHLSQQRSEVLQTKLTVGPAGDRYEQEADRVAKQVMGAISTQSQGATQRQSEEEELQMKPLVRRQEEEEEELQMKPLVRRQEEEEELQMKPLVRRQEEEEEELQMKPLLRRQESEEEEMLQAKTPAQGQIGLEGGDVEPDVEQSIQQTQGGGQALPDALRSSMENAFSADFSGVRVHNDTQADSLNDSMQARAFTTGQDIYLRQGEYNPGSSSGQELLAHELTHVVQQNPGAARRDADPELTAGVGAGSPGDLLRLVDARNLRSKIPPPKAAKFGKGKTKRALYDAVISAVDTYNKLIVKRKIAVDLKMRFYESKDWYLYLKKIQDACYAYMGKNYMDKAQTRFFHLSGGEIDKERTIIDQVTKSVDFTDGTFTWAEAIAFEQAGLAGKQVHAELTGQQEVGEATKLGGGQISDVYKITYDTPNGPFTGVFKGNEDKLPGFAAAPAAHEAGIPKQDTNTAKRAVAFYRLDQLFGTGVIPKTVFGMRDGQMGSVMEFAGGEEGQKMTGEFSAKPRAFNMSDPELQRQMSNLQLIDAITGQVDRHPGNYKILQGLGGTSLWGIDNDFAFGETNVDPSQPSGRDDKFVGLPVFVDAKVAARVRAVKKADVQLALDGLLTAKEIATVLIRLSTIQTYLDDFDLWVEDTDWGNETAGKQDYKNSYWGFLNDWGKDAGTVPLDPAKHQ